MRDRDALYKVRDASARVIKPVTPGNVSRGQWGAVSMRWENVPMKSTASAQLRVWGFLAPLGSVTPWQCYTNAEPQRPLCSCGSKEAGDVR